MTRKTRLLFAFLLILIGLVMASKMSLADDPQPKTVTHPLSTSRHVVYASQAGAHLDSDVHRGGGTDDTEILQAVLNRASELGHLHLVMDGASLVRGLDIHSNTTIECLNPACGFFLNDGANRPILQNAHPSRGERKDRNITLLGGTYNQNCLNQAHHIEDNTWVVTLGFFGVECLTMRDLTIRNQRTFAMSLSNWFRVTMENIYIDLPDKIVDDLSNQDRIHVQGPGQFLVMRNIQGCSWDDFIALNADDVNADPDDEGNITWNDFFGPYPSVGPITDVLIDGVTLHDAAQGIRLMSRGSRLDRVVIRNVTGTYRSFGFYISTWLTQDPRQKHVKRKPTGEGNFGHIIFDTIDLRQREPNYHYVPPFLFHLDGRIDSLTLQNLHHHEPIDNRPLVHVLKTGVVGALTINGLSISEKADQAADARYIQVEGRVENLTIRNAQLRRASAVPQQGCLVQVQSEDGAPVVNTLRLIDVFSQRMGCLVSQQSGSIGTFQLSDVLAIESGGALFQRRGGEVGNIYRDAVYGGPLE
jgi:hypothetical protein